MQFAGGIAIFQMHFLILGFHYRRNWSNVHSINSARRAQFYAVLIVPPWWRPDCALRAASQYFTPHSISNDAILTWTAKVRAWCFKVGKGTTLLSSVVLLGIQFLRFLAACNPHSSLIHSACTFFCHACMVETWQIWNIVESLFWVPSFKDCLCRTAGYKTLSDRFGSLLQFRVHVTCHTGTAKRFRQSSHRMLASPTSSWLAALCLPTFTRGGKPYGSVFLLLLEDPELAGHSIAMLPPLSRIFSANLATFPQSHRFLSAFLPFLLKIFSVPMDIHMLPRGVVGTGKIDLSICTKTQTDFLQHLFNLFFYLPSWWCVAKVDCIQPQCLLRHVPKRILLNRRIQKWYENLSKSLPHETWADWHCFGWRLRQYDLHNAVIGPWPSVVKSTLGRLKQSMHNGTSPTTKKEGITKPASMAWNLSMLQVTPAEAAPAHTQLQHKKGVSPDSGQ